MIVAYPEMNVPREPSSTTISYPIAVHDAAGMQQRLVEEGVAPLCKFQGRDIEEEKKEGMTPPRCTGKEGLSSKQTIVKSLRPRGKLRKQLSEPSVGRRSIFGGFWEREASHNDTTATAAVVTPPRRRSASISIPAERRSGDVELNIRRFAPPSEVVHTMPEYFHSPDTLPKESEQSLPKLPSPLQRFYKGGKPTSLGGMYPLNAPSSILRESSYQHVLVNEERKDSNHDLPSPSPNIREESFNLTKTRHAFQTLDLQESSVSSSTSGGNHRVHFDPRVTVTEYEDHCKRVWYSDPELEGFKYEAINLARQYLLKHPEMIDVYNKPHLDPITCTMRKKALYSMPALSTPDDEEGLSAHVDDKQKVQQVVDYEVKNILLIDRNRMILDLFRRTLQPLFPRARITAVQSGEEALRLLHIAMPSESRSFTRGYDIIVAEERLRRPLSVSGVSLGSGRSDSELDTLGRTSDDLLVKRDSSSMGSSNWVGMTGSELFRRIVDMEAAVNAEAQEDSLQSSVLLRSLLIGVSMHPEQDAKSFFDNGADFVWGKPPPIVDDNLRDQLVSTLMKKRQSGYKEPEYCFVVPTSS